MHWLLMLWLLLCCRHALVADWAHQSGLALPADVAFCVKMLLCACIIYSFVVTLQVVIYMQHLQHAASEP